MKTAIGDGGGPGLSNKERQKPRGQIGHAENAHLLEEQYEQWRVNPSSVDATWRAFFEGFELGTQLEPDREVDPPQERKRHHDEHQNGLG